MSDEIQYSIEDQIALLCINRPQARNALNWAGQEQFAAAINDLAQRDDVRCLIVTGSGDKAFASGGDLKEHISHPEPAAGERLNRIMSLALARLAELPFPVIAAVNGDAIGGGCEILTACDLRLAVAGARFRFAQVRVGLTTGWGGTGRLVRLLGQSRALELLLTGRTMDAVEAQSIGFVHRSVPEDADALAAAYEWADELKALPRKAVAATKRLAQAAGRLSLPEIYQLEARLFSELWPQDDHLEAMAAFVEKRPPRFE